MADKEFEILIKTKADAPETNAATDTANRPEGPDAPRGNDAVAGVQPDDKGGPIQESAAGNKTPMDAPHEGGAADWAKSFLKRIEEALFQGKAGLEDAADPAPAAEAAGQATPGPAKRDESDSPTPAGLDAEAQKPTASPSPAETPAPRTQPPGAVEVPQADARENPDAGSSALGGRLSAADGETARAIEAAGEQFSAAIEKNTRTTVAMFGRMLGILERQNRQLADMERRISELGGRTQSQLNP